MRVLFFKPVNLVTKAWLLDLQILLKCDFFSSITKSLTYSAIGN